MRYAQSDRDIATGFGVVKDQKVTRRPSGLYVAKQYSKLGSYANPVERYSDEHVVGMYTKQDLDDLYVAGIEAVRHDMGDGDNE